MPCAASRRWPGRPRRGSRGGGRGAAARRRARGGASCRRRGLPSASGCFRSWGHHRLGSARVRRRTMRRPRWVSSTRCWRCEWDGGAPAGPSEVGAVGVARGPPRRGLADRARDQRRGADGARGVGRRVGAGGGGALGPAHLGSALPVRGPGRARSRCGSRCCGWGAPCRRPRSASSRRATTGRPHERVRMTGTFGTLDRAEPVHRGPGAAGDAGPGRVPAGPRDGSPVAAVIAVLDRMDARIDPSTAGFAVGRPSGRGVDPGLAAAARRA